MRRFWIFVLIVGIAIAAMSTFHYLTRVSSGDPAPLFTLPSVEAKEVSLEGFTGRPVLLHFFATWCGPCRVEFPTLGGFQGAFEDAELVVLAVSLDEDVRALKGFVDYMKPQFPVLMDGEGRVADSYQSYAVPESFLIGIDGTVLWRHAGPLDWSSPSTIDKVRKLLEK